MNINNEIKDMINDFSKLEEVEGILLAGSHAMKTSDKESDYDIYVYVSKEVPIEKRKAITNKFCSYIELNNTFWETEDDGILKGNNIPIEIIYRDLNFFDNLLNRTLVKCEADIGYTTCLWSNLINSIILYDKHGNLSNIQAKYRIAYPQKLKEGIVKKNYPLLKQQMSSYYHQIEKALKRYDYISVNHRVAALFSSYFDIIFAINEMPHPGEKKLLKIVKDNNLNIPLNMELNIKAILKASALNSLEILDEIDSLVENLDILLKGSGFLING